MPFKKPQPRQSRDRLSKYLESSPIRKLADTIIHPRRALSDAKEAQLEKRRISARDSLSTAAQSPSHGRSRSVPQPPAVLGERLAEFPNTASRPRSFPRPQDTIPKLTERTNLGHLAPPGIMYRCMSCQILIGTEFGGRRVEGQYLCPQCRTKVQQGFIPDFKPGASSEGKPSFI